MSLSWVDRRGLRVTNAFGFVLCAGMIGGAYYMELVMGLEPCPLCILQRIAVVAMGLVFLVAAVHGPRGGGRHVYGLMLLVSAGTGTAIAGRHLWLQRLPEDQVPACGPGLEYMLDVFPLMDALRMVLQGSGECAEVEKVLGVTLPGWTLAAFILVGLYGVWTNMRPRERAIWL
ncbi:MAG: disulfide bond formation protein B [Ectothiorhodospiraceae bacterium]|nr:disulfide bond formation protein B [Ectothiorhodospiraceae bacterium]